MVAARNVEAAGIAVAEMSTGYSLYQFFLEKNNINFNTTINSWSLPL